jgi:hypothetical protein
LGFGQVVQSLLAVLLVALPPLRTRCGEVWHRCAVLQEFWVCW